jgi:hypothetical protein
MNETRSVGGVQGRGDLLDDVHGTFGLERAGLEHGVQVHAVDQPHGQIEAAVDFTDVMDRHDVGFFEASSGAGLAAEAPVEIGVCGVVGQQHLERHDAVDGGVVGLPHLAHAAAAQQFDQLVAAERRPFHALTITGSNVARGRLSLRRELDGGDV